MFISPLKNKNTLNEKGIKRFQKGQNMLETTGKSLSQIVDQATLGLRSLPGIRSSVYPWNNYDLDYKQIVKNKYHPDIIGISEKPTMKTLLNNVNKLNTYSDALMYDPLPDSTMNPGKSDLPRDPELMKDNRGTAILRKAKKIKSMYARFKPPYPSFYKDFPYAKRLTSGWIDRKGKRNNVGESSGSFFIQSGYCPLKKIHDSKKCKDKGFTWIPNPINIPKFAKPFLKYTSIPKDTFDTRGTCFKPRYSYVDNRPKAMLGMKGQIPNLMNDVQSLAPDKMFKVFTGEDISGFGLLPCIEHFGAVDSLGHFWKEGFFLIGLVLILCIVREFIIR
jgi:hypothetical protein